MTYKAVKEYMEQVQRRGSILGLAAIKALLNKLGNPQDKLKVIHVAGTNGKGSICTFLESMYRAEGKKVGRYISPTLHCYLERFQINGEQMKEEQFTVLLEYLLPFMESLKEEQQQPTAFELETVIAFLYFLQEQVDLVILETGMGGREDATNVVTHPLCTVFASIGRDHMQFLGDTVEKIVIEKAGIMKTGCPAVSYPGSGQVVEILKQQFLLRNKKKEAVEFRVVNEQDIQILSETLEESRFIYRGVLYRIQMAGRYQIYNAVTAIETKLLLDGSLIRESLMNAVWEGRFEKVSDVPLLIRDGAHNVDGARALKVSLQKHFTNQKILFIIGVLQDKEYDKMMEILCPMAAKAFTVTPCSERGLSGSLLRESILPYCKEVTVCSSVESAVAAAQQAWQEYEQMGEEAVIIAWGSLSYIGQINEQSRIEYGTNQSNYGTSIVSEKPETN